MSCSRISLLLILAATLGALSAGAFADRAGAEEGAAPLPAAVPSSAAVLAKAGLAVDARLKKNVDFWLGIYTRYYTHQGLIHDSKYIEQVYEVLDFGSSQSSRRSQTQMIRQAKKKWRAILLSLHRKNGRAELWAQLSEEEQRVAQMYEGVREPNKFLAAAQAGRMRFQLGQKDRFVEGLQASGRYLPEMEAIFRREGLPVELTRLPFVESSFNLKARSKVGASGIWQFMRSTGKRYLKINAAVDERNDPIRATEAAAKLLKANYQTLGKWGLAVTAYNHGTQGMVRAVRKVGSDDLESVVEGYQSRSFGFASANFFTELLAAIEAEREAERYFGLVRRATVEETFEVVLPRSARLSDLSRYLKLDSRRLQELNPALSGGVYSGRVLIPAKYRLRLPADPALSKEAQERIFLAGYEQITKPVGYATRRKNKSM